MKPSKIRQLKETFGIAGLSSGDNEPAPANSSENIAKYDPLLPRVKKILRRKKPINVVS